jgi:phosphate transport system permease protein
MYTDSTVTLQNPIFKKRRLVNKLMLALALGALAFGLFWLFWIIYTLIVKGGGALSVSLLTEPTPPPGAAGGGLLNAIIGSVLMAFFGTLMGTPVGILAGTYLAEYGKTGWLTPATRFLNDVLLSAPSIVIGLFIYAVYVAQVGHYSGWAGACALAILVVPVVVRSTDNMLSLVPNGLREAAAALGCPKWKITLISYRAARSGMMTGILLAIARISGETAPLLFTALNNQFMSLNMNAPIANLPVVIFQYAASPFQDWNDLAWAGAVLITLLVLGINILARVLFRKK